MSKAGLGGFRGRGLPGAVVAAILAISGAAGESIAQVPGVAVLQNAFVNPGLAFAANVGAGSGQSFFGAAAAWGLGGGRLQLSAAAGAQRANEATRGAYGARAAATAWTSAGGALGLGAFVGVGGAPRTRDDNNVTTNPAVLSIPAGISVGYRRSIGATRGFSIFASPMYRWTRAEANQVETSGGSIGGAVGLDFAVTRSIGVTAGADFGRASGSTSSTFGFALTFVPGR